MNKDLQIIKKKYGENMSKLCREMFARILETDGLLSSLILEHFDPSHQLYNDLVEHDLIAEFKNYVYSLVDSPEISTPTAEKTPSELLAEAGYILYECKSEEDIQSFKKYYAKGEELCTFNGGRLDKCMVFFAVKQNVDRIKREKFLNPERQDLYGTSVISIQFTKDGMVSIKNRYNHRVSNPDATFGNNLDNIIPGLTEAFEKEYSIVQQNGINKFEIPNYVQANNGRYYKYNYEINNKYYCPNNIIIDHFEVKQFEKEKYIVFDYFILDLQNKKVLLYDSTIYDSFCMSINKIEKIVIINIENGKEINITPKNGSVIKITLDHDNRVIKLKDDNVKHIGKWYLFKNTTLEEVHLANLEIVQDAFLTRNIKLRKLFVPKLKMFGDDCLVRNRFLKELELDSLIVVGFNFLYDNAELGKLYAPNLKVIAGNCLYSNKALKELDLPSLEVVEPNFLFSNTDLTIFNAPKLGASANMPSFKNKVLLKSWKQN